MQITRRNFLAIVAMGSMLWCATTVGAADSVARAAAGDTVQLTLDVQGMH